LTDTTRKEEEEEIIFVPATPENDETGDVDRTTISRSSARFFHTVDRVSMSTNSAVAEVHDIQPLIKLADTTTKRPYTFDDDEGNNDDNNDNNATTTASTVSSPSPDFFNTTDRVFMSLPSPDADVQTVNMDDNDDSAQGVTKEQEKEEQKGETALEVDDDGYSTYEGEDLPQETELEGDEA